MKLLLDECVPRPLRSHFPEHEVFTIEDAGFKSLKNGALIRAASESFDVLITVDKNLEFQQNRNELRMAILVFDTRSNRIERLLPLIPDALDALRTIGQGEIVRIAF